MSGPPGMPGMPGMEGFGGDMFGRLMGDILKMMDTGAGGVQWPMAYELASRIAAGDAGTEPNPDPIERIRFDELSKVAQLHVTEALGMSVSVTGGDVHLVPSSKGDWARRILDTWKPVLERLAAVMQPPSATAPPPAASGGGAADIVSSSQAGPSEPGPVQPGAAQPGAEGPEGAADALAAMFGRFMSAMAPTMTAMQAGSVAGHLASSALGQYDVPLAPVKSDDLWVVTGNLAQIAEDWSLPIDDLRLWLCVHEMATHAVLSRPGIANRIADLVVEHAKLAQPDAASLQGLLQQVDPTDPMAMSELLSDPAAYVPGASSGELQRIRGDLDALTAAIAGHVEHVTALISDRIIGKQTIIGEAMRRRRVSRGEGEKVAEALFGLSLDQAQVDRGERFVAGVLDREGEIQLTKMWSEPSWLPTPAEIEAPGLWLARIDLPAGPD
jgi:putative hydrolase